MKKYLLSLTAIVAFVLVGPAMASAEETKKFSADKAHSNIMFRANHMNIGYVFGEFLEFDGTLEYNKKDVSKSSLDFSIDAESVQTNNDKRDKHLKGPDFLNAKKHQKLTFKSKKVDRIDDKTLEVTGDLTIRDTTKSITFKVKQLGEGKGPQGNYRRGFYTEFDIDRTEFGVNWNPDVVMKKLRLILSFEFVEA